MDQTEATLLAAGVAAGIALLGIWAQARSQARAARVALHSRRLDAVGPIEELVLIARGVARRPLSYRDFVTPLNNEEPSPIMSKLSSAIDARSLAHYLFGPEVQASMEEVIMVATAIDSRARQLATDRDAGDFWVLSGDDEINGLGKRLDESEDAFRASTEAYLGKDRYLGLRWLERHDRIREQNPLWWDDRPPPKP